MVIENLSGISSLISALAAIGAVIMSFRNSLKIKEVHISINSRMDQMLAMQGVASKAEGNAEGLAQGRNENVEHSPIKVDIVKLPPDLKA